MPKWGFAAVPWYANAQQYQFFLETAVDRDVFFPTFEEWVDAAITHEKRAEENGVPIIRICLDWQEFSNWCGQSGFRNDAEGRSEFADQKAVTLLDGK